MQAFASHHHHAGATTSSITPRVSFLFHAVGRVITDQHAIFIWGGIIILPSSMALCPFVLDWLRDKLPGGCSGPWLPAAATCQRQGKRKRTLGREEIADTQASNDAMHFSYRFPNWGTCVRNTQPFACCRCYCCRSDLQGFTCFWNPISFLPQADEALIYLFVKCSGENRMKHLWKYLV